MPIDHKSYATEGLYPGLVTTQSVANLGSYIFEVIIEKLPVGPPGSAGGATDLSRKKDKYKVTMRVRHKDRVWEYERIVGPKTAQVAARLIGKKLNEPDVQVKSVTVVEGTDPTIEVYKK